jgi:aminoglycoside 2'-N-acetyltransferase I
MSDAAGNAERPRLRLRRNATAELSDADVAAIRDLLWRAFPDGEEGFTEADWQHALGGVHFILDLDGEVVAHASVVPREIQVAGRPLRAGYVEAVATAPQEQGRGYGTRVMEAVGVWIRDGFELGALGTGAHRFYERLGWESWAGPSFVRTIDGLDRTPDDDGYILVLRTPSSPPLDTTHAISCPWRPGDVW